jgi:site-specific DNA-methyltransferase (adenine-specific)
MQLYHGDCLELMPTLPDQSVDMILANPPYGTTACDWDTVIPFAPMWEQYERLIKPRGAIVLFGSQPFTSALIMSNVEWFKYCWVWDKAISGNPLIANFQPLKTKGGGVSNLWNTVMTKSLSDSYYPVSILNFSNAERGVHPTQKPVSLLAYLIRTYTNPGDTVLDNCMGSGSTGVACIQERRNFIGIEKVKYYFEMAQERIANTQPPLPLTEAQPPVMLPVQQELIVQYG